MSDWLIPLAEFQKGLAASGEDFFTGLRHGSMRTLIYAPKGTDPQTPHKQDELYIVISGKGRFRKGDEVRDFGPGDVIFVEACKEHRFEDFTDDFVTWAVFWGPDGGE
jgi:mannose-6-phosphate isomerase-like protein (cupin superfamily)